MFRGYIRKLVKGRRVAVDKLSIGSLDRREKIKQVLENVGLIPDPG